MKEQDLGVKWFNTVFYPQKRTGRAVRYEDGILPRLRKAEVMFFTPWGPRYSWQIRGVKIQSSDKEVRALNFLAELFCELKRGMPIKNLRWLFLGADIYGTKVNSLPEEVVKEYFASLSEHLRRILPEVEFKLWSEFGEAAEIERQRIFGNFSNMVSPYLLDRAKETARKMDRGSDAKTYLVERLAEAEVIERLYQPIKISLVARHKDDKVDGDLPRLYLLPEDLLAPWM